MHQFPKFTPAWNSTCFGEFLCPSSGVYSLYTRQWFIPYSFEDSFRAGPEWSCLKAVFKAVWHTPLPSVQWINSWWWAEELPETCRVSYRSKFRKLVHLVGFIIKKFVTMQGHMNVIFVMNRLPTMHGAMNINIAVNFTYAPNVFFVTLQTHDIFTLNMLLGLSNFTVGEWN